MLGNSQLTHRESQLNLTVDLSSPTQKRWFVVGCVIVVRLGAIALIDAQLGVIVFEVEFYSKTSMPVSTAMHTQTTAAN